MKLTSRQLPDSSVSRPSFCILAATKVYGLGPVRCSVPVNPVLWIYGLYVSILCITSRSNSRRNGCPGAAGMKPMIYSPRGIDSRPSRCPHPSCSSPGKLSQCESSNRSPSLIVSLKGLDTDILRSVYIPPSLYRMRYRKKSARTAP